MTLNTEPSFGKIPIVTKTNHLPDKKIMADNQPPSGENAPTVDAAAASVAKLHLDEVTGNMVSKTELKKLQKAREKEAAKKEKAEKSGAAPAGAQKPKSSEAAEKELTPNQVCLNVRLYSSK